VAVPPPPPTGRTTSPTPRS